MEELSYLLLDQGTELPARAEACAAFEEESEVPAAHVVGAHWAPSPPGAVSPPPWLGDYGFFFGLTESASRCATQLRSDFSRKQLAKMALNGEVKLLAQSDPGWAARVVATDVRNNGTGRISERATALRPHPSKTARHLAWLWACRLDDPGEEGQGPVRGDRARAAAGGRHERADAGG